MENPKDNPFGNGHGLGIKDSANTDVIYHRGQVLATWYLCGTPMGLDPLSLESYGAQNFLDTFYGDMMAHPKVDELTGELMWFDHGPDRRYMRYGVIGADRIFYDRSLVSRFAVIPRYGRGDQVRWFEAKPCYVYHVVNSLSNMLAYMRLDAQLYRYRFDLRTGEMIETDLDDDNIEFPSVDSRIMGRVHRFSYSMRLAGEPTLLFDGLVRYDSQENQKQEHFFGPGRWGSEAPFAPRDNSTGETDGYLMSFVTDEVAGTAEVDIFDASDITVGPVARVMLPQRIPSGFHACWVQADQLRTDSRA